MNNLVDLVEEFKKRYSYICVSDEIISEAISNASKYSKNIDIILDTARDYILSQDLAEDVVF